MKKLLATCVVLVILASHATLRAEECSSVWCHEQFNDLFDTSQGTVVTGHSPLSRIPARTVMSDAIGAGPSRAGDEPRWEVHFSDDYNAGFEHWFEFETISAVTVRSIGLIAWHDRIPRDQNARGFTEFRLYGDGQLAYSMEPSNPYGTTEISDGVLLPTDDDADSYARLAFRANLPEAVTAQEWRAVFVQASSEYRGHASGPRVLELDGFSFRIPEPASLGALSCLIACLSVRLGRASRLLR